MPECSKFIKTLDIRERNNRRMNSTLSRDASLKNSTCHSSPLGTGVATILNVRVKARSIPV
jgi:hypothetical protein